MSEALKPCPFCGGTDLATGHVESDGVDVGIWGVDCRPCDIGSAIRGTEAEARRAWNTRPVEDALRARIAELEALLKAMVDAGVHADDYEDISHYCVMCDAYCPVDPTDHAADCPWRMAKEWLNANRPPAPPSDQP